MVGYDLERLELTQAHLRTDRYQIIGANSDRINNLEREFINSTYYHGRLNPNSHRPSFNSHNNNRSIDFDENDDISKVSLLPEEEEDKVGSVTHHEFQYEGEGINSEIQYDMINESDPHQHLHRDLKTRHVIMIAIGGAIGTGLLINTGDALYTAGPASLFIAYSIVGLAVYMMMCSLCEMITYLPLPEGLAGYSTRFVDPALGFAFGYTYWIKFIIVCPNQLIAGALIIQYWIPREVVNPGVWITILFLMILLTNYFGVKFFGEVEYCLSFLKILILLIIIFLLILFINGVGSNHNYIGFKYWKNPGGFKDYQYTTRTDKLIIIEGPLGKFTSFCAVFINTLFSYLGTELVGVTAGETENPRKSLPRAVRLTFFRITIIYCISIFLIGLYVRSDNSELQGVGDGTTNEYISSSPFVIALSNVRGHTIKWVASILNAALLLFVFSSSNSDLYFSARTLYGLALNKQAPRIFTFTTRNGTPIFALLFSSLFCCLAYVNCSYSSFSTFQYFVNVVTVFGLLGWISIMVTHIFFMKAIKAQGLDRKEFLPYVAPFQPYGTYLTLGFFILVCIMKNFTVFIGLKNKPFDYKEFISGYIGIPIYLVLIFGYKIMMKSKKVLPEKADLWKYISEIEIQAVIYDDEERKQKLMLKGKKKRYWLWFYRKVVSLLF